MLKSFLAASAALLTGSVALASPQATRSEAFAVRACPVNGVYGTHICYNEKREATISFFGLLNWPLINHSTGDKVIRVDCTKPQVKGTRRAEIAEVYCPLNSVGLLKPAPFI